MDQFVIRIPVCGPSDPSDDSLEMYERTKKVFGQPVGIKRTTNTWPGLEQDLSAPAYDEWTATDPAKILWLQLNLVASAEIRSEVPCLD